MGSGCELLERLARGVLASQRCSVEFSSIAGPMQMALGSVSYPTDIQ